MATFQELGDARIGTITETALFLNAINQAIEMIVNGIPADKLMSYVIPSTHASSATGVVVQGRITGVEIGGRRARMVDATLRSAVANGSIWTGTALFPKAWIYANRVYGTPDASITVFHLPAVVKALTDQANLPELPPSSVEAVITYGILQVLMSRYNTAVVPAISAMPAAPTPPATPTLTYAAAAAASIADISIGALPLLTPHVRATFSPPSAVTLGTLSLPTLPNIDIDLVLSTFNFPDLVPPTIASSTIAGLSALAAHSKPTISVPPMVPLGELSLPNPPSLFEMPVPTITYATGTAPTVASTTIGALTTFIDYTKPTIEAPTRPDPIIDIPDFTLPTPPSKPVPPAFTYTDAVASSVSVTQIGALPTAPAYTEPPELADILGTNDGSLGDTVSINDVTHWFSTIGKQIENEEDPELAQQMLVRMQLYANSVQAAIENATQEFNANNADFQAEAQRLISQAQIAMQEAIQTAQLATEVSVRNEAESLRAQIEEYASEAAIFQVEVAAYQSEVQALIAEWETLVLQRHINFYINEYQVIVSQYAQDIQNESANFNASLQQYQVEANKVFEQARIDAQEALSQAQLDASIEQTDLELTLQAAIAQATAIQNRFNVLVNNYQAEVEAAIQEWTLTEFQGKFNVWMGEYQNALNEYQLDTQNEIQASQVRITDFQTDAQHKIEQANINIQAAINQAQINGQTDQVEAIQGLEADVRSWQAKLERYGVKLQEYQLETQQAIEEWRITEWQGKFEKYMGEYNNALQAYQLGIQSQYNDFQSNLPDYQAEVEKILRQSQISLERLSQNAQLQTSTELQNATQELQEQIAQYQGDIGRFQNQIMLYQADIQKVLQKYNGELNKFQAEQQKLATSIEMYNNIHQRAYNLAVLSNDGAITDRTRN